MNISASSAASRGSRSARATRGRGTDGRRVSPSTAGGSFALQDTFGDKDRYGKMEEFLEYLKEHDDIDDITYVPNIARHIPMPFLVRFMLRDCGLIYGRK